MAELKPHEMGVRSVTHVLPRICSHLWETHTSRLRNLQRGRRSISPPSVTQGRRRICCCLICIPGWQGKFKFGITSDCWPEPISDLRFSSSSGFRAPHNKTSHSLEQTHVSGISKNVLSLRLHELKADSGEGVSGLAQGPVSSPFDPQLSPSCTDWGPIHMQMDNLSCLQRSKEGWKEAAYVSPQEPGGKACPTRGTT